MTIAHRIRQTTLKGATEVSGIGVHSGLPVTMRLRPAANDTGVVFIAKHGDGKRISASFRNVNATELCTAVGVPGASVATIEHLMAALSALGVDNVIVEIDGPEVPIMDGSSAPFVDAIDHVGIARLEAPLRYLRVLKTVRVEDGEAFTEFSPHDGRRVEVEINFANPIIGLQTFSCDVEPSAFRKEICAARTFGFLSDVERLTSRGLARGASLENAVVLGDSEVLNPEGLRWADEFVRHKLLDAIGDISLAGMPILGRYRSRRGGHRLNFMAVQALLADESAWEVFQAPTPRQGVRAERLKGGLAPSLGVAFAPEVS